MTITAAVSRSGERIATTLNPATGEALEVYRGHTEAEVEELLTRATEAQRRWRETTSRTRGRHLAAIANELDARAAQLAALMTEEMGKPVSEAEAEIRKCAWVCRHYADRGGSILAPETVDTGARESFVRYDPLGVILAIMPWNFPFWQVFRFAAPALAAGNALLIKHAPSTFGCALAIEELVHRAGLPAGLLSNIIVDVPEVGGVIADPRIASVTLTGSGRAGRAVAAAAGGALKKSVLELGGSDPFIVWPDANLDLAVAGAVAGRCMNSGQSCCASKRFIVHADVAGAFEERFASALRALVVADPLRADTQVGPLARADLRDTLDAQVRGSVAAGARLVVGGAPLPGPGFFYPPTLLVNVAADMPVWNEETFGPVAALRTFSDDDEAVALANDTEFGLCATLWTENRERATALAARVDAGGVFVNRIAGSDPRMPFGGVKHSGYGRELGMFGLREFVNVKTIWVE